MSQMQVEEQFVGRKGQRHASAPLLVGIDTLQVQQVKIAVQDIYHLHQHMGDATRFELSVRPEVLGLLPIVWEFKATTSLDSERWVSSLRGSGSAGGRSLEETEKDLEPAHTGQS